jgi:TolA-binding protein
VRPQAGARYLASATGADELVWLTDGAIDVEVEALPPGERFRVLIGGAEVEVRGTAFTVTARAAHLTGVTVARGRVDVRPETGAAIVLGAGQAWHPAIATAAPLAVARVPVPVPPPAPHRPVGSAVPSRVAAPRASAASPHDALAPPSPSLAPAGGAPRAPEELSYDRAWEALRANQFAQAAGGFARVLLLAPDSPLVEDASFWHAVALARGKRSAEALSAFRDFLDTYGRSARAGEASAMLGWILVDARDYDEAGRRFRAAVGDGNPAVARSARAGLDALAAHAAPRP